MVRNLGARCCKLIVLAWHICILGPMEIGSALSAATTVIRNLPEDPYPPSEPTFLGYI